MKKIITNVVLMLSVSSSVSGILFAGCIRNHPRSKAQIEHTSIDVLQEAQEELTALEYVHAVIEELEHVAVQAEDPAITSEFMNLADGLRSMLDEDVEPELIALLLEQIVVEEVEID